MESWGISGLENIKRVGQVERRLIPSAEWEMDC